jgi:hypothetical protein
MMSVFRSADESASNPTSRVEVRSLPEHQLADDERLISDGHGAEFMPTTAVLIGLATVSAWIARKRRVKENWYGK